MDQKKIGAFIRELRKGKGLTQEQLAEKFNVSGRTVSRWETGSNMPDISLLTNIADFFDIDVRELIDGERRGDMNEEIKEVADKMADYAGVEKGRLLKWVRVISLIGSGLMTIALVLQCINYQPSTYSFFAVLFSFIALIAMAITTLYANGVLSRISKNKTLTIVIIAIVGAFLVIALRFIISIGILFGVAFLETLQPAETASGKENYDKQYLLDEWSGELNGLFMVFPDNLDNTVSADYNYNLKSGLFDTDGYVILKAKYTDEEFENEVNRISHISCRITFQDQEFISDIKYDTGSYNYPAYVTNDGFDDAYEYALINDADNEIIYAALSFPQFINLSDIKDYTKKNSAEYNIEGTSLDQFTIYSHRFDGNDWWDGADLEDE